MTKHQLYRVTAHQRGGKSIVSSITFHVSADNFDEAHKTAKEVATKEGFVVVHVDHKGTVYTGA